MRRRVAREATLQILYSLEKSSSEERKAAPVSVIIAEYLEHFGNAAALDLSFLEALVAGTIAEFDRCNELIQAQSDHWKLERMALVDRNILRMSLYELMFMNDVPSSVSINEAVEIGKRYGTEESGAFINGILDQIRKSLPKNPNKAAH